MKLLLFTLMSVISVSAIAKDVGEIKFPGNTLNIVDTYTVYNEIRKELIVYFLPCKYRNELKKDWKVDFGFLKCHPISEEKYFSSPGASLTIKLLAHNKVGRVIFSTTKIGERNSDTYSGFSKSWFRNAPINNLTFHGINKVKFIADFDFPRKGLIVSLRVNSKINETIK